VEKSREKEKKGTERKGGNNRAYNTFGIGKVDETTTNKRGWGKKIEMEGGGSDKRKN